MKRIVVFIIGYLSVNISLLAQVELNRTTFDLGEITLLNDDIIDLQIENLTEESIFLLRIESPRDVSVKHTSKQLGAGNTETLRFKLNPQKKGKIKRTVRLYFSSNTEPIALNLSANVKEIPKNNRQACPAFGKQIAAPQGVQQEVAEIQVEEIMLYDQTTDRDLLAVNEPTNDSPVTKPPSSIVPNPTALQPPAPPREPRPKKVRKSPEERRNAPSLGNILFGSQKEETDEDQKETISPEPVENENNVFEEETVIQEEIVEEEDANLLDNNYRPNNIIFLIDASTSMREDDKMDLLKEAMIELLIPLRSTDYLSIVTYSGEAQILMPPTSAVEKVAIEEKINNIMADGSTQAVKGIKKAIQVGKSNFIEDGNNQIILATDGAFDIGSRNESLRRKIKSNASDGLRISVIGIKNEKWTNKSLKEIVELGEGNLIKLSDSKDASKLLEEVKEMSLY